MLTGSDLLAKVDQLRSEQPGITNTELVLACGYVRPDGKAAYTAFYGALIAAKQPQISMVSDEIETDLEFSDEEELEKFEELCESYPQKAVEIYYENIGNFDDFEEAYQGEYSSEADFTEEWIVKYDLQNPSWIVIDYQATWDSALRYDYWNEDNYFFQNI